MKKIVLLFSSLFMIACVSNESKPIKNLHIDSRPVLHHFRNNDDFEYIAMKCEQDIIEIVNRILKYE